MQEQDKMEMVWQAPELVELGDIFDVTKHGVSGNHGDGATFNGTTLLS